MTVATRRAEIRMHGVKESVVGIIEENWSDITPSCPDRQNEGCAIADGECGPESCPKLRERVGSRQLEDAADGGEEWES